MKHMKLLSIDWDYFFPDPEAFDWGHNETRGIMFELIWATRPGCRRVTEPDGPIALDVMKPDPALLNGFWERTAKGLPWGLSICESHKSLYEWVMDGIGKPVDIVNFDAHHDSGYGKAGRELDCGNWAKELSLKDKLRSYTVVYPPWRKKESETHHAPKWAKVLYEPPPATRYDFVFICRSGAWTPTWHDDAWIRFIEYWKEKDGYLWDSKMYAPFALKTRSPNMEESKFNAESHLKMIEEMKRKEA